MPVQSNKKNVRFPDGCEVAVSTDNGSTYFDVGAILGSVEAVLNYDENLVNTANAGTLLKQIKNMTMTGSMTIINQDPEVFENLGAGIISKTEIAGTPVASPDNQVIASGSATDVTPYALVLADAGTVFTPSSAPSITSVTGATDGLLVANDDYTIIVDQNASSGYSIVLNTAGATLTTMAQVLTIVYGSSTPIAETQLDWGTSTLELNTYILRFTHYTDDAKSNFDYRLFTYAADVDSGGLAFSFKGAEEDGVDEIPFSFTGRLDTGRADGKQLATLVKRA